MQHLRTFTATAALVALAGLGNAQTTHDVNLLAFDFAPENLTIDLGDTVRWTWVDGIHDVKSGVGGIPNGFFDSGSPTTGPLTFEVTFDQAFLNANPVPGNLYDYYCTIHVSFNMVGSIKVEIPPMVTSYGCGNPVGSLSEISGAAVPGQVWTLGVNNPIAGGQTPGSLAFLGIATQPAPGFPCGLPLPGFHLDPLQPTGELLLSLAAPNPIVVLGPAPWPGPGTPAQLPIPLPPNPALTGVTLHLQGLIVDPVGANTFGATDGIQVVVGG